MQHMHKYINKKYISKTFYNLSGVIPLLLLCPSIIYVLCFELIKDYENNVLKIISIISFAFVIVGIIATIILNVTISKKRYYIYKKVVKQDKNYTEGFAKLNKLLSIPQARMTAGITLLHISYTKMLQMDLLEALKLFDELKEFNLKFKIQLNNNVLASYYKILIYLYLDDNKAIEQELICFKQELIHFNSIKNKNRININLVKEITDCINAIEKNDINELITILKNQTNPFVISLIEKLKTC